MDGGATSSPAILTEFSAITLDVNDLALEAEFWGAMLGEHPGPVRSGGGWQSVGNLCSGTFLVLQLVPEKKTVKDRLHMDFWVGDVGAAAARIVELGGSKVSGPRPGGGDTMADPEGNEFCIGAFHRDKLGVRTMSRPT